MKKIISILPFIICVIVGVGCSSNSPSSPPVSEPPVNTAELSPAPSETDIQEETLSYEQEVQAEGNTMQTINIQVGNKNFKVTLYDTDSTQALLDKLPLTLNMDELNGNEKFYFFSEKFPANSERVGNIKTGDLMLYGSDCLVLFYESFSTSYSYTRLGYMEDVTGLAAALGRSSVQVTFNINN